ncbi:MAG TPA: hypothetical protein VFI46_15050 [Jiangellaceae bacterium]|nr:hypothetical protein [Jiangellaceae bacterium]
MVDAGVETPGGLRLAVQALDERRGQRADDARLEIKRRDAAHVRDRSWRLDDD